MDKLFADVAKFIYMKYKDKLHTMLEDDSSSHNNSRSNSDVVIGGPTPNGRRAG